MLRTPVNDYTLLDVIRENKFNKNDLELIELINEIIEPVFGPACWELFVDDESHTKVKCKTILNEELMLSELIIPYDNKKTMKIKFVVPGYVE